MAAIYGIQTNPSVKEEEEDAVDEAVRHEHMRKIYQLHYSGLQAPASNGLPKLQSLVEAAEIAKEKMKRHAAVGFGASVLTTTNRLWADCNIESLEDPRYNVCAERAVLLKAMSDDPTAIIEAMVITSDLIESFPYPCGSCREFMVTFGNFPVFLMRADACYEETSSFALFPRAYQAHVSRMNATVTSPKKPVNEKEKEEDNQLPLAVKDWSVDQVVQWLEEDVQLAQYTPLFRTQNVDGVMLLHLEDCDLQLLLKIVHPLHRRRLLVHIDRLKDRELMEHGLTYGQLQDYLAVLDRDRIEVVAKLKTTFDRLDANHDGFLDFKEVKQALQTLQCNASAQVVDELLQRPSIDPDGDGNVSFADFCLAFSSLAAQSSEKPSETQRWTLPLVDLAKLRSTFDKMDKNKNGSIDEQELVSALEALGRENCTEKAREWFQAVDFDGDKRLSFAEFVVRYMQLTNVDLAPLQKLFESFEPVDAKCWKPTTVLCRSLERLLPNIPRQAINDWCAKRLETIKRPTPPQASELCDRDHHANQVLSYAEFVLSCLLFRVYVEVNSDALRRMRSTMENHALCHRSRIVHLQQSGHVRLCAQYQVPQQPKKSPTKSSQPRLCRRRRRPKEESKSQSDDETETNSDGSKDELWTLMKQVESTFSRFVRRGKRQQESKGASDEDEEEYAQLMVIEAAQALLELGISCSRQQIVRVLQDEGFGPKRLIDKRSFLRVFQRLSVFQLQRDRRLYRQHDAAQLVHARKMDEMLKLLSGDYGRHANRKDYDEYLLRQNDREAPQLSKRKTWKAEMQRLGKERGRQHKKKNKKSRSDSSSSREERRRRRARRSSSSSSSERRRRRRRSSSSSETCSSDSLLTHIQKIQPRRRPLKVGDRVTSASDGHGTIVRLYRDFFVADVHFDSGKKAKNVDLSRLKSLKPQDDRPVVQYEVGMAVAVSHKGTKSVRRGRIVLCRTNGTFDVRVTDAVGKNEVLSRLASSALKPLKHQMVVFQVGTKVCVRRKHEYLRARVHLCRTNGTYDVQLKKNNKILEQLRPEVLLPDENESEDSEDSDDPVTSKRKPDDSPDEDEPRKRKPKSSSEETEFAKGDRVEARYQGKATYYPGKILRANTNGTYDIAYDDGDHESQVATRLIRVSKQEEEDDKYASDSFD